MTTNNNKTGATIFAELSALLDSKGARMISFAFNSDDEAVVYAKWNICEYVTWKYNVNEPAFYYGHYHGDDENSAIEDFHNRSNKA